MDNTGPPTKMEASLDFQLDLQMAGSGANASGTTNQEQPSGMERQQYLPTEFTPPVQQPVTNETAQGQGRPGFVDSAERWTEVVVRKLERSKRTGQACNRCKACFESSSFTVYLHLQSQLTSLSTLRPASFAAIRSREAASTAMQCSSAAWSPTGRRGILSSEESALAFRLPMSRFVSRSRRYSKRTSVWSRRMKRCGLNSGPPSSLR